MVSVLRIVADSLYIQESGCEGVVGAGMMQVYIAHAAPFGYWGRLDNAKDDKKYIEQFYI